MTKERILSAIKVIEYAIKHGISVKEASVKSGYADTYVKNAKRAVNQSYDAGTIEDDDYNLFMSAYENYTNLQQLDKETTIVDMDKPITEEKVEFSEMGDTATVNWTNGAPQKINLDLNIDEDYYGDDENKNHYGYPPNHIKTLNDLLERAEVDLDVWKVERHVINKWDTTSAKSGYPSTWENFQVKATLVRRKEVVAALNFAEIFQKLAENYSPPPVDRETLSIYDTTKNVENNLLEVSLFDLHIGKLGWAGEVGENYDTKIARARYFMEFSSRSSPLEAAAISSSGM
jgi:hypothetical protein